MLKKDFNLRTISLQNQLFKKIDIKLPLDLLTDFEEDIKKLDKEFSPYSYGDIHKWDGLILNEKRIKETNSFYQLIYKHLPFEEIKYVRVFRLKPEGYCGWHTEDWELQEKDRVCCTLNIALNTCKNSFISFEQGRRLIMKKGDVYFLNFSKLHSSQNLGDSTRYHLKVTGLMKNNTYKKYFNQRELKEKVNIWSSNLTTEVFKWKYQKYPIQSYIIWADDLIGERIIDFLKSTVKTKVIFFHTNQNQLNLKKEILTIWPVKKQSLVTFVENFCQKNNLSLKKKDMSSINATLDLWNNEKNLKKRLKNLKNNIEELKWIQRDIKNIDSFLYEQVNKILPNQKKVFYLNNLLTFLEYEKRKNLIKKMTSKNQIIAFSNNISF